MTKKTFNKFYYAIPTPVDRSKFRMEFLKRSGLSYPTFDIYKNIEKDEDATIPHLSANVIIEIAKEQHPQLLNLLS